MGLTISGLTPFGGEPPSGAYYPVWISGATYRVENTTPTTHAHNDLYYTEAEIDALLTGKASSSHNHDDRYFTESEISGFLTGKSDVSHNHDDRYFTETELSGILSGKVDDSITISGQYSISGGGDLNSNRLFNLVGDVASPGNSKVYGTDASGVRGFRDESSVSSSFLVGMEMDYCVDSAPNGWVRKNGGSIGNAASSATERANADTEDLFTLLYNNYTNTECPVSGGRGANAAADFAANKTITLPDSRGKVSIPANTGTFATKGAAGGAETHTLIEAELPIVAAHNHSYAVKLNEVSVAVGGDFTNVWNATTSDGTEEGGGFGSGSGHNNLQPYVVTGCRIIKL